MNKKSLMNSKRNNIRTQQEEELFEKESFTKETGFLVKVFAKQKSFSTGSFFRKKVFYYNKS